MSGRCLEGVWGVSGGCLDDSRGLMCKQFIYMQLDSSLLAASFSPSGLGMDKKWGVCGVPGRCLWDVWMVWESSGILPWVIKLLY